MSYEVLEKQIQALPEEYLEDVSEYVQLLLNKVAALKKEKGTSSSGLKLGLAEGMFNYPDDIHAGDDIIADAFEDYV